MQAEPVSLDQAVARAVELAPEYKALAQVARAVNDDMGLDWSPGRWRGIWKSYEEHKFVVEKQLGSSFSYSGTVVLRIPGNVRGAVISDIHAPYHDVDALRLAAEVVKWWSPDVMVWNGDDTDFYGLSTYEKNPARKYHIQDEVDLWQRDGVLPFVSALRRGVRRIKTKGNHCDRLRRFMWANPELFYLRSLQLHSLLDLEKLGIEYVENRVLFSDLLSVSHGIRVSRHAGYSAKAELDRIHYGYSTITGHVHRSGRTMGRVGEDRWVVGQEVGCLCTLDPEYNVDPDWRQGMALFEVCDGRVNIVPVDFFADYTCSVQGKWFGVD